MLRVTASLVVYRTPLEELIALFRALERDRLAVWLVVDNAASENVAEGHALREAVEARGGWYVASPKNVGFGAGHNLALRALGNKRADYHLMLNPDTLHAEGTLEELQAVMDEHSAAALLMPKVVYPDGEVQRLCKLLPTPIDFLLRRFAPKALQRLFRRKLQRYEMWGIENSICDKVPFLSGCFMFTRSDALLAVNGFDERYFLYMEDVDLCRRLALKNELLYWPRVTISHGCYRGAYKNRRLMWIFIHSAVRYFNRWGWIVDKRRRKANRAALSCLP